SRMTGKGVAVNFLITLGVIGMSLAIVLSKSRSGLFLLALTFLLFIELTVLYAGMMKHRQVWIIKFLKVIFLIITLMALYIGVDSMISRFSLDNLLQEGRPLYWGNVVETIKDFPLLGTGLGTFAAVYPAYEKVGVEGLLLHAHNDFLEYFSELGLLGFFLLSGLVLFLLVNSFLVWKKRRYPEAREMALGCIIASTVMLIHSFTDFNLHIPANMLLFSVVLSLAYVTVYYRKS
ncbi:MAG: O-antigen ligase family protein, partial [Candidatus Aminicenantales bacterium]